MRKYDFRLASVARIRALEESVARDRYLLALRDLRHAQEKERTAKAALEDLESPTGLTSIPDLLWIEDQAKRLADWIRFCKDKVQTAESACHESRQLWNEATKRSGVLEKLGAQELARWRVGVLREEVAEMDDLSNSRHGLRGGL